MYIQKSGCEPIKLIFTGYGKTKVGVWRIVEIVTFEIWTYSDLAKLFSFVVDFSKHSLFALYKIRVPMLVYYNEMETMISLFICIYQNFTNYFNQIKKFYESKGSNNGRVKLEAIKTSKHLAINLY